MHTPDTLLPSAPQHSHHEPRVVCPPADKVPSLMSSCADRLPEPLRPASALQPQQEPHGVDLIIMNAFIDMA